MVASSIEPCSTTLRPVPQRTAWGFQNKTVDNYVRDTLIWLMPIAMLAGCSAQSPSAQLVLIEIGTPGETFQSHVQHLGGEDITEQVAFAELSGAQSLQTTVWEFADYGAIFFVTIDGDDTVARLAHCAIADFRVSKSHGAKSTVEISRITFNLDKTTKFQAINPSAATNARGESSF